MSICRNCNQIKTDNGRRVIELFESGNWVTLKNFYRDTPDAAWNAIASERAIRLVVMVVLDIETMLSSTLCDH